MATTRTRKKVETAAAEPEPTTPAKAAKAEPKAKKPAARKAEAPEAAETKPVKAKAAPKKAEPEAAEPAAKPAKAKAPRKAEPAPAEPETAAPAVPAPSTPTHLPVLVQALLQAAQDGRAVELIFKDAEANAPRTFEPRHLTFDTLSKAWYVWGWDRRYNAERHHRADHLAEVNAVEGVGRNAQGPYKEGTPGNLIGGWLGGEPIAVKATLMKQWIFAVKQAPPAFPEFRIQDVEEGKAQVTFTATDLRAVARWAMQFGDGIQVQEPQRLVDRIKQVGAAWLGKDKLPPAPAPQPAKAAAPAPAPAPARQPAPERERERKSEPRHREEPKASKPSARVEVRVDRL